MYKIIYMGGYNAQIVERIMDFKKIELVGVIIDYTLSKNELIKTKEFFKKNNIEEIHIEDISTINPDMIFLCNYTKILDSNYLDDYLFINIHAGILPQWRGFNANCWSILNGNNEIGYTIHRVREGLDSGEIYNIISVKLENGETYFSGREKLKDMLCSQLEEIFVGIISGDTKARVQEEDSAAYTCRLKPTDGEIVDWNKPAAYIEGLFRVFFGGSGTSIKIKDKSYVINDMNAELKMPDYLCIPGAVINKYSDGSVLIKTMDKAVRIRLLQDKDGNIIKPGDVLKIGVRL